MADSASEEEGRGVPGRPPRENLFRSLPSAITIQRAEGGGMPTLSGHFSVFDTWTRISSAWEGTFMERVAPGAFSKTIQENRQNMRVLFNHGTDPAIGDKVLGPITDLREDETGAYYEVRMLDTSYNRDLLPGLEANLYGASFRFKVMKERFDRHPARSESNPDGIPERTIEEAQVMEFGPVTFGAYPTATAGVRSVTDDVLLAKIATEPARLEQLIQRAGISLYGTGTTSSASGITINITNPSQFGKEPLRDASDLAEESENRDTEPDPTEDTTPQETPEPDASERTTPPEPEPSEATTRSNSASLFWLADTPEHLKET